MKLSKLWYALAAALAVLAGTAVYLYQSSADSRALAGKRAVTVLVAKSDLAVGTRLGDALLLGAVTREVYPAAALPSDVVTSVTADNDNLRINHAIDAGQLLLQSELSDYVNPNALIQVPAGRVAVSVNVDDAARVANFVQPGARVVAYWTPTDATESRVLLPAADVLAVGATSTASSTPDQNGNNALVTFALTPDDAPRMVLATKTGTVYLGLLPKAAVKTGNAATDSTLRAAR